MTCTYCDRPDYCSGFLLPPMCEPHHELLVLYTRLEARGVNPTVANLEELLATTDGLGIQAADLPGLLAGVLQVAANA